MSLNSCAFLVMLDVRRDSILTAAVNHMQKRERDDALCPRERDHFLNTSATFLHTSYYILAKVWGFSKSTTM